MEQDDQLYEYRMGSEAFRFEAHGPADAAHHRVYALLHFRDRLGARFSPRRLEGPWKIELGAGGSVRTLPSGWGRDHGLSRAIA